MNAYKKYKNRIEKFLQTEQGKRFINFAYSFGAAIVILGAMFKLLHFPFGNEMLFIGMVTECIVFILSAFDTPVRDYRWEQVFPALSPVKAAEGSTLKDIGSSPETAPLTPFETTSTPSAHAMASSTFGASSASYIPPSTSSEGGKNYIPHTLSTYSEEYAKQMDHLNRTLSGLNSIYEVQLKSVSSQIGAIEQVNQGLDRLRNLYGDNFHSNSAIKEETEKMAMQLRELNKMYARMLNAMTVSKYDNLSHPTA